LRQRSHHPENTRWQIHLVYTLFGLAKLGDDPALRLRQAVGILRRLQAEEKLTDDEKRLLAAFEDVIASSPQH